MGRIPVSGHNTEVLTTPGSDMRWVIAGLNPDADGRTFYLTRLELANTHATDTGVVVLADQDEAAISVALQRGAPIHVPAGDTVILTWADGEMPFVTNCTIAVTGGTIAIYDVAGSGYLA